MYKSLLNVDNICRNNEKKNPECILQGDTVDRQGRVTAHHERRRSWNAGRGSIIRYWDALRWRWPHWHGGHGHLRGHVGGTWGTGWERGDRHPSWRGRGKRIIWWARSDSAHERRGALHTCSRWWTAGLRSSFLHFEVELKEELGGKITKTGQTTPLLSLIKWTVWLCVRNADQYLFGFSVPVGPEAIFCFINFSTRDLKEQRCLVHNTAGKKLLYIKSTTEVQLSLTLKAIVS